MPTFTATEKNALSMVTRPIDGPRNCPHAELPKWADGNLERLVEALGAEPTFVRQCLLFTCLCLLCPQEQT